MINEQAVAQHYGEAGLGQRILEGLASAGKNIDQLAIKDLAPVDEFHIGGRPAAEYVISKLLLQGDERVLDVGCGIGGAVRTLAAQSDCQVSGIDLTPEYIEVADMLTARTGLADQAQFHVASALDMPFEAESFDAVLSMHVAMNIADRDGLYREIARVSKKGARFCCYDVMKKSDEPLKFPVPWAENSETSHLTTMDEMRGLLENSGFEVLEIEDRSQFAREFFEKVLGGSADQSAPAPVGLHLIMGASTREKLQNVVHNMTSGSIVPVQLVAVKK